MSFKESYLKYTLGSRYKVSLFNKGKLRCTLTPRFSLLFQILKRIHICEPEFHDIFSLPLKIMTDSYNEKEINILDFLIFFFLFMYYIQKNSLFMQELKTTLNYTKL